jgi:uncharacterized phage protein (TIGR02216 family)
MGFGLGVLRLSPSAFWRMTPRELAAAIEAVLGPREIALDRVSFAALRGAFPTQRQAESKFELRGWRRACGAKRIK